MANTKRCNSCVFYSEGECHRFPQSIEIFDEDYAYCSEHRTKLQRINELYDRRKEIRYE